MTISEEIVANVIRVMLLVLAVPLVIFLAILTGLIAAIDRLMILMDAP
jgi:hypothetical protein